MAVPVHLVHLLLPEPRAFQEVSLTSISPSEYVNHYHSIPGSQLKMWGEQNGDIVKPDSSSSENVHTTPQSSQGWRVNMSFPAIIPVLENCLVRLVCTSLGVYTLSMKFGVDFLIQVGILISEGVVDGLPCIWQLSVYPYYRGF